MGGAPQYPLEQESLYIVLYNTEGYDSLESLDAPIREFQIGESVVVLEKNLGEKSNFFKVIIGTDTDKEYYIRSAFLGKNVAASNPSAENNSSSKSSEGGSSSESSDGKTGGSSSGTATETATQTNPYINMGEDYIIPNTKSYEQSANSKELKLKDAQLNKPYKENRKYNIVVDTGFLSKQQLEENIQSKLKTNVKYLAFLELLKYYGKDVENITEEKILDITTSEFNYVKHSDPYFPVRPGQNARLKIMVEEKYFQIFENISFEKYAIANIHRDFISCNIRVNELDSTIKDLSKVIQSYQKDISKFSGELKGLSFKKLLNDLRKFLSEFKKYLSQNNVVVTATDFNKLELGFNVENFRLEYVLYYDPYGRFLRVGMDQFCKSFDAKLSKLLINYKNIMSASVSGMGWMDFVKEYFAGEFKISFVKPSQIANSSRKAVTDLKDQLNNLKSDFENLSLMIPKDISNISSLKKDDNFMQQSSELLLRSKDAIGDNFLVNLPDILANVEDLETLYTLVFDKVSVKDLLDVVMENVSENLNLPDINEAKMRGILKMLNHEDLMKLIPDIIDDSENVEFLLSLIDQLQINKDTMDEFLSYFDYLSSFESLAETLLYYDESGNIAGIYTDFFDGDLQELLDSLGMGFATLPTGEDKLSNALSEGVFRFSEIYQQIATRKTLEHIVTNIIAINPVSTAEDTNSLVRGTLEFFANSGKSDVLQGIDNYFKNAFKNSDDLFEKLIQNKKIKTEFDKLNLSKKKLLKNAPGLDINLETKKMDASFSMPSIKKINPSFDFSKFQFDKTGDIFGSAISAIEKSVKDGIEGALVSTFKNMLNTTLESINKDSPDIDSPDYGGINFNDMFDATGGFSAKMMANLVLSKAKDAIEKFDPTFCEGSIDISAYEPTEDDITSAFDQMSSALKPMEMTRILKGQKNKKDYDNIVGAIEDENMRQMFTEDFFNDVVDTATDFVDLKLINDIEKAYDNKEVLISVCEKAGIPYCIRDIKKDLMVKYQDFTDDEICDLIDNMVDEVKDSIVDSIANLKEDFSDNLPFNEDPCSFMPSPTEIEPLNFVNDITFDAIFNPIELEYKAEAVTVPDLFLNPSSETAEFVQMFFYGASQIFDGYEVDENGKPEMKLIAAVDSDAWVGSVDGRLYNQDFSNHYFGRGTSLYRREPLSEGGDYNLLTDEEAYGSTFGFKFNSESGEFTCEPDLNVYVRKTTQTLKPVGGITKYLRNPTFELKSNYYPDDYTYQIINFMPKISNPEGSFIKSNFTYQVDGTVNLQKDVVDLKNPVEECTFPESVGPLEAFDAYGSANILKLIADRIMNINDFVGGAKYAGMGFIDSVTEANYIKRSGTNSFIKGKGILQRSSDNYANIYSREKRTSNTYDDSEKNPLLLKIIADFMTLIFRSFSESPLLDTSEMLAFVIDDEDINLFKVQDAKNSAKNDNNENCSFEEDDRSIEDASTKQLVYLMIRIYVIEKIVRNCIIYSITYPEGASNDFCDSIYDNMASEIGLYPENFYENVFKENYQKLYKEKFDKTSESFRKIVKEIYLDISTYFSEIFRNANDSLIKSILRSFIYDIGGNLESLLQRSYNSDLTPYTEATKGKRSRFVIQRALSYKVPALPLAQHEIPWADGAPNTNSGGFSTPGRRHPDAECVLKICYVFDLKDSAYETTQGYLGTLPSFSDYKGNIDALGTIQDSLDQIYDDGSLGHSNTIRDELEYDEDGFVSGVYRYSRSTSHQINKYSNGLHTNSYYLLPLGYISAGGNNVDRGIGNFKVGTVEQIINTIMNSASTADPETDIYHFITEVMRTPAIFEYISYILEARVVLEKPEIMTMFLDTKNAIRNAMNSLYQDEDNYAYEEKESQAAQLEQASEASTNPTFSPKASKMALMTIPMIVKGMAETFDPNTQIASGIRAGFSLAGVDIPPPVASLMAMPLNVIPFAPGPPITPLGLLYIGSSFLEPKERKRLSDLKRGKNMADFADPETGAATGQSLQELADSAESQAIENSENAIAAYKEVTNLFVEYHEFVNKGLTYNAIKSDLTKDGYGSGELNNRKLGGNVVPLKQSSKITYRKMRETMGMPTADNKKDYWRFLGMMSADNYFTQMLWLDWNQAASYTFTNTDGGDWEDWLEHDDCAHSRYFYKQAAIYLKKKFACDIYLIGKFMEILDLSPALNSAPFYRVCRIQPHSSELVRWQHIPKNEYPWSALPSTGGNTNYETGVSYLGTVLSTHGSTRWSSEHPLQDGTDNLSFSFKYWYDQIKNKQNFAEVAAWANSQTSTFPSGKNVQTNFERVRETHTFLMHMYHVLNGPNISPYASEEGLSTFHYGNFYGETETEFGYYNYRPRIGSSQMIKQQSGKGVWSYVFGLPYVVGSEKNPPVGQGGTAPASPRHQYKVDDNVPAGFKQKLESCIYNNPRLGVGEKLTELRDAYIESMPVLGEENEL